MRASCRDRQLHWMLVLLLVGGVSTTSAQALRNLFRTPKPLPPERQFVVDVPMHDGTKLSTQVTLPEGKGPWPAILTRTPYGKGRGGLSGSALNFVEEGWAYVVQESRGTGESEGEFGQFHLEKGDGVDTLAWIGKQPWCKGKVGMFGVSAGGILANLAAMGNPPELACSVVIVAHGCSFRFGSYNGGVFIDDLNQRWYKALGHPLENEPKPRIGVYDDVAADMDMKNNYGNVHIPTLNVCGWYDCFMESGIENFEGLQHQGAGEAKGNQKLVVGAFGHLPLNGKLKYPAEAKKPSDALARRWFRRWLNDEDNGIDREPPARYYLMGDPFDDDAPGNQWIEGTWPPPAEETTLWLGPNNELRRHAPTSNTSLSYQSDPKNPVPTVGGNNLFLARGPMDQRDIGTREDVLRFVSEPLTEPLEVIGRIFADLRVSTDGPDTDFIVKLVDIYPDGYEALVLDQPMRLRYRDGLDAPKRAEPSEVYDLRVKLGSTALVFNKGHRIAVMVQSTNSPRFEPHSNTWEPVASYDDARVATNTVHLGGAKGSRILLPVTKLHQSLAAVGGN